MYTALQNLQLGTLKEVNCRKRFTVCVGQGVLHIVYGSRIDLRKGRPTGIRTILIMKARGPLQNWQLGTLKEADCRNRFTFCGGQARQGVLHIVYGSRVDERI